jgi:hypothetical protein
MELFGYGAGVAGLGGAYEFDPENFQRDAAIIGLLAAGGRIGVMRWPRR